MYQDKNQLPSREFIRFLAFAQIPALLRASRGLAATSPQANTSYFINHLERY